MVTPKTTVVHLPEVNARKVAGRPILTWTLFWSPEGRPIARVRAATMRQAIAMTPEPYKRYRGEVYALQD